LTPNGVSGGASNLKAFDQVRYVNASVELDAAWLGPKVEVLALSHVRNARALSKLKGLRVLFLTGGDFDATGTYAALENLEVTEADALRELVATLAKAMSSNEPAVLDGATRFLIGGGRDELVKAEVLGPVFVSLARRALANPSARNRWSTFVLLGAALHPHAGSRACFSSPRARSHR
jgi:hypothetical protein